jgi:hypothetical protein
MRSGSPVRRPDGSWQCTWSVTAAALGRDAAFKADAVVSGGGFERALAGDLLSGFACPQTIGAHP